MKTRTIILLLALTASAFFLFGAKAAAKKLKWRYLPAKWSEPARITELELACFKSEFRATKPLTRKSEDTDNIVVIDRIIAKPGSKGLKVTVRIKTMKMEKKATALKITSQGKTKKTTAPGRMGKYLARRRAKATLKNACADAHGVFRKRINKQGVAVNVPAQFRFVHEGKVVATRKADGTLETIFD